MKNGLPKRWVLQNQLKSQKKISEGLAYEKKKLAKEIDLRKKTIQVFNYHFPNEYGKYFIEPLASGTLIELEKRLFLLTAAHVSDWQKLSVGCQDAYDTNNPQFQSIEGTRLCSLKMLGSRDDDKKDWCLLALAPEIETYFKQKYLIPPIQQKSEIGSTFTLCGYPLECNKVKRNTTSFLPKFKHYSFRELSEVEYKKYGINPDEHIALFFNHGIYKDEKTGKNARYKSFKGFSGGPIFDHNSQLVAIFHTCRKSRKVLIGIRIRAIINFINQNDFENKII